MHNDNSERLQSLLARYGIKEMSDEEIRKLASIWANHTWEELLDYIDTAFDFSFEERVCKDVAHKFGGNDRLSALLISRLRIEREGKPKGPQRKWTEGMLSVLLDEYNIKIKNKIPRNKALDDLAKAYGFSGLNKIKKIEEKISQARKTVDK